MIPECLFVRVVTLALPLAWHGAAPAQAQTALTRIDAEVAVRAAPTAVWSALTTPAGLRSWIAPESRVELEPGGAYELYFWPDSADRGMEGTRVLSYVPGEMLSVTGELDGTWVVWRLEPGDGGTTVRFTGLGHGEAWRERSRYFDEAMPGVLEQLKAAVEGSTGR